MSIFHSSLALFETYTLVSREILLNTIGNQQWLLQHIQEKATLTMNLCEKLEV